MSDTPQVPTVIEHAPPVRQLHPLVEIMQTAMAQGGTPDVAMMRDLVTLQREWEAGEARKEYTRAMVRLKADMPTVIAHDRLVDYPGSSGSVRYTHSSLAAVMEAVTGPLTQHGFSLGYDVTTAPAGVTVVAVLTHADGHSERVSIGPVPADTKGGKGPAQAIMSTITMVKRYAATSLLGIATADMHEPEGERAPDTTVDPDRNLRAVTALVAKGKTREQAEARIGRPVSQWTIADLDNLRSWLKGDAPVSDADRKAAHHPSWPADQRAFFAALNDLGLAKEYESVASYASVDGGPRPSGMDGAARADLLGYLATAAGMKHYRGYAAVGGGGE